MSMKPMLAAKLDEKSLERLSFPLLASPKLDGIRCLTTKSGPVSRNLKSIRNLELQGCMKHLPDGLDGELVIPGRPFGEISSVVMSKSADAKLIEYWVFDYPARHECTFEQREALCSPMLKKLNNGWVGWVPQTTVNSLDEVLTLEQQFLADGFEGIMLRDPEAAYKYGRSTVREQGLMKLKRFVDSEAEVLGVVEMMLNCNVATRDELGRTKRSSAKAGKVKAGIMGALKVRDCVSKVTFEIGTGFDTTLRAKLWKERKHVVGRLVKYKYQPTGVKEKPRFPVFLGFRSRGDM